MKVSPTILLDGRIIEDEDGRVQLRRVSIDFTSERSRELKHDRPRLVLVFINTSCMYIHRQLPRTDGLAFLNDARSGLANECHLDDEGVKLQALQVPVKRPSSQDVEVDSLEEMLPCNDHQIHPAIDRSSNRIADIHIATTVEQTIPLFLISCSVQSRHSDRHSDLLSQQFRTAYHAAQYPNRE
jgi:hypothetical protein